ncbi:DUF4288 domain-containing protein [Teredinibacter turnerae]|uniref:DUF4288 domain-containing protein n=1 Tax=Teredinibacter turnerae TaxID=2426 RepID=UPI00035EFE56|nr:DUF4288 domain-containing protein [Teredinibacter turnerae]
MNDKNLSPVGWYVGSYLIRFIELNEEGNEDLENRFLTWENTIIVKASNLEEAYDKIVKVANDGTEPYEGGPDGVPVQWVLEGVTSLLPIYEELEDGAEIMWAEHNPKKLKNIRKMVTSKEGFKQ